ncbi:MAG: UbiA family prenyltransferase [Deltaproteobacteria bacterium]|nr:UbiA family prenyltransferase [Deltaproteobacteria bacterium]
MDKAVLAVDLDGTYIKGDITEESFVELLKQSPLSALVSLVVLIFAGRCAFKNFLVQKLKFPAGKYGECSDFIRYLKEEKHRGRKLILISASHYEYVKEFKGDLFDEVYGTTEKNLSGENKVNLLKRKYGSFDYAGNDWIDFVVFKEASTPILVNGTPMMVRKFQKLYPNGLVFCGRNGLIKSLISSLRPYHWFKNSLIFVAPVLAHEFSLETFLKLFWSFISFCLLCSGNYVWNDLLDIQADRQHNIKRFRPLAAGDIRPFQLFLTAASCLIVGLVLAFKVNLLFFACAVFYLAGAIIYSGFLKRVPILDIFVLSALYILRIIAGAVVSEVYLSQWFLIFCMFSFLSLASVKRASEISHQKTFSSRNYQKSDFLFLQVFGLATGILSTLVYLLYLNFQAETGLYSKPIFLWMIFPVMLYWYATLWIKLWRGEQIEDPLIYILRSRVMSILLVGSFILYLLSI